MKNKTRELLSQDDRSELEGEVSWEFGVISKTPKRFYQQKPKSVSQICCRLSPQCTKTIEGCLRPQMDCFKKVRLAVLSSHGFVSKYTRELEQVMSCSCQEFS